MKVVQVPGCKVVTWNDEIRFCGGDGIRERPQRPQSVVGMYPLHSACLVERMPRRTDSSHGAPCIGQSYCQSSSREPTKRSSNQDGGFQLCPVLPTIPRLRYANDLYR